MPRYPLLLVVALGLVAGCSRMVPPAPYELHTRAGPPSLSEQPGPHPDTIRVANGDTLYGVSRHWGVPMRAIIDANGLTPPYRLVSGASLVLPQVRTHVVQTGDTLASVARQYGVDSSTLAATNHLAPPYVIRTGEALILPAPVETARAAPPQQMPPPVVVHPPPPPPTTIAAAPPPTPPTTPTTRILAVSPLAPAAAIAAAPPPTQVTAVAPPRPAPPVAELAQPAPEPPPAAPAGAPAKAAPEPAPAARLASLPPPVPVPGKGFLWPVRGRIVSTYGTGPEGTHNDGINIAAPAGTPVLAADAGEVAYAGNELKGYGNLILLKHPNGFISAYAHNERLLVKRGDKVVRGQPIAKVGASGAVAEPQLHFEIRRGARALDPTDYLPAQAATASR